MPTDDVHPMPPPRTHDMTAPSQDNACHDGGGPDHSPSISAQCPAPLARYAAKERLAHKIDAG